MTAPTTTTVEKARLSIIPEKPTDKKSDPIAVQFNPTSLKISRANNPDSAKTTQGQKRQHSTPQPATLTFDLEFDTAEIADGDKPMDVRKLTAEVRKFVTPGAPKKGAAGKKSKKSEPPPRILFEWGPLRFPGIVTNLTEDLDYFSPSGIPLRAKLSITITEQDMAFEANAAGPGAVKFDNATKPGEPPKGTTPGTKGTGSPTSVEVANASESVPELLTRTGADPSAWRAAMNGLTSPIGLEAGAQVQLDAGITAGAGLTAGLGAGAAIGAGAGLGVAVGFSASAEVSAGAALGGALGMGASAGVSAGAAGGFGASAGISAGVGVSAGFGAAASVGGGVSAELSTIASFGGSVGVTAGGSFGASEQMSAGFVLAAGGGVTASANLVAAGRADAAATLARSSFNIPSAQTGGSLGVTAIASPLAAAAVVDARATSYGQSIPLRARASAVTVTGVAAGGQVSVSARAQRTEIVVSPRGAPWQRLTDDGGRRSNADRQQRSRDDGPTTMRWTPGR
jgi:hypothetical protein